MSRFGRPKSFGCPKMFLKVQKCLHVRKGFDVQKVFGRLQMFGRPKTFGRPKSFGMEVQEYGTNKRTKMSEMFKIIQMKTMPKGNTVTTVFFDSKICKKYCL